MATDNQAQRVHVIMAVFATEEFALDAFNRVRDWSRYAGVKLHDLAIVSRSQDGKVRIHDEADPSTAGSVGRGAAIGGAVGLIFPPSIIVGAAVGGAIGGVWGHFRDKGIKDKKLEAAGAKLQPGQSAVIAATGDEFERDILLGLTGIGELHEYFLDLDSGEVQDVPESLQH